MIILIQTLVADSRQEVFIDGGVLVVAVVFGIILIKSTLHEIVQRERIEKLAADLRKAYDSVKDLNENLAHKVAEQTKEVKRAYEVEKRAHDELAKLDETKNQLITAAQHNLRTPLTALRWQLEKIRKSGGNDGLQESLKESEASVERLTGVLEDFLKITEMRVGNSD